MLVDDESSGNCTLLLSGYLRARKLSVNQLVINPFCSPHHALCYTLDPLFIYFLKLGPRIWRWWFSILQNWSAEGSISFEWKEKSEFHGIRCFEWWRGIYDIFLNKSTNYYFRKDTLSWMLEHHPSNLLKNRLYSCCTCVWFDQVLKSLVPDPIKQEPLVVENTPDPLAGEQVSLTSSLKKERGSWLVLFCSGKSLV